MTSHHVSSTLSALADRRPPVATPTDEPRVESATDQSPPRLARSQHALTAAAWSCLLIAVVLETAPSVLEVLGVNEHARFVAAFLALGEARILVVPSLIAAALIAAVAYGRESRAGRWPSPRVVCLMISVAYLAARFIVGV